ncbi:hypothetical protein HDU76_006478, partial [Blyttiomyces sp. JEL0837]
NLGSNQISGAIPPGLKTLNVTIIVGNTCTGKGCSTKSVTTTSRPTPTIDCFPKSMSKYLPAKTVSPTPNIYGVHGDLRNATCDPVLQALNSHCLGVCVVECLGTPFNSWKYLQCKDGYICKKVGRSNVCVKPSPSTTMLPYIPRSSSPPTLPQSTSVYQVPPPNTQTQPAYQPTPTVSNKCFDYTINGPFIPSTGPNMYGPNGDAEGAPCDTEAQVNNLHCAGSCVAQCAQNKWTYLTCPNGLICRADLGAPVCGFPYDYIPSPPTPVMTYNPPVPTATATAPPTNTYAVQDQSGVCFPTNIPGYTASYNPLPVPNIYGTQGDALNAPCDTEGQVNNTHCVGACVAQCAQSRWTYLNCPSGLVCRGDLGAPVCGFPQLGR